MSKKYTVEEIAQLKQISIADYARNVLGMQLIRSGRQLSIVDHDSVLISEELNLWNRFSDNSKGAGGDIISFVQYWEHCSFQEALDKLAAHSNLRIVDQSEYANKSRESTDIQLPEKDDNVKVIYSYLIKKRGIEPKIISKWINDGFLYQGKNYKECIFTGYHKDKIMFATKVSTRETGGKYDVENSIKEVGIYQNNNSDTTIVLESPIDAMSYQSIMMKMEKDISSVNYLIVSGAKAAASAIYFNKSHYGQRTTKYIIALDNDQPGFDAMGSCIDMIEEGIFKGKYNEEVKKLFEGVSTTIEISQYKDWNEDLHIIKEEAKTETPSMIETIKQMQRKVGVQPLDSKKQNKERCQ